MTTALLIVIALTMIGTTLVSAARDADWWVIARGVLNARCSQARRLITNRR